MHRFELAQDLATGNSEIDCRHRTLFAMANVVLRSRKIARDPQELAQAVEALFSHMHGTFAFQEVAMRRSGYDRRLLHSAFHDYMRRQGEEITQRLRGGQAAEEIKSSIFFLLEDWTHYHVRSDDQRLASFLNDQSSAGEAPRPLASDPSITAAFSVDVHGRAESGPADNDNAVPSIKSRFP